MMKRGGIVFVASALLALAGCAAPVSEVPSATVEAAPSTSATVVPAADPTPSPSKNPEDEFVEYIHRTLARDGMDSLSDKEILKYGKQVCKELSAGATHPLVVQGKSDEALWQSRMIGTFAPGMLCP